MSDTPSSKVTIIELNEFNLRLLEHAAVQLDLPHIKRVLAFEHGSTVADQEVEHQGLDPWVQWVTIHTGVPSNTHGVLRAGDVGKLKYVQIWERLSASGITTGVWGVMNARRGKAPGNKFFVTDPWTYDATPYPPELENFLALPRYYAKNYLSLSRVNLVRTALRTAWYVLREAPLGDLVRDSCFLAWHFAFAKQGTCFLFAAYELISARVFARQVKQSHPDVLFFFINAIAHFQHHEWKPGARLDRNASMVFRVVDRILSIVLPPAEAADQVLILNGLSQRNVIKGSLFCYRPIDPARFLRSIGLSFRKVEQCMTNDSHVFFYDENSCRAAAAILRQATIEGHRAFYVEIDSEDSTKLFYQVEYWGETNAASLLRFEKCEIPFFSEFAIHARRTGAHVAEGDYFVRGASLPPNVKNEDILAHLWPALAAN